MIEQLFGSKTRVKLLKLFFSNPNRSFYVREITRKVEEQINSVRRELANLLSLGLITSDSTNNKLYYEVNQKYEHYDALRSMFSEAKKTATKPVINDGKDLVSADKAKGQPSKSDEPAMVTEDEVELPEAKQWTAAGNITGVAYSGVYTRDESAGVDIVVIGDAVISKIESVVSALEREKNRELRYALIEPEEWKYRRQVRDKFWLQFMAAKKQIVLDRSGIFVEK